MKNSETHLPEEMMDLQLSDNDIKTHQSSQSILGVMKNFIESVNDMDETVLIPSRLLDMQPDPSTSKGERKNPTNEKLPVVPSAQENVPSLHAYYAMLKAVKTELVRGPSMSDDEDDEGLYTDSETGSESSDVVNTSNTELSSDHKLQQATAKAFREHLHGLFNVLEQLTDMSKSLTSKYQRELGDDQSCTRPKAFSISM